MIFSPTQKIATICVLLITVASLTACGQTGALYLPKDKPAVTSKVANNTAPTITGAEPTTPEKVSK